MERSITVFRSSGHAQVNEGDRSLALVRGEDGGEQVAQRIIAALNAADTAPQVQREMDRLRARVVALKDERDEHLRQLRVLDTRTELLGPTVVRPWDVAGMPRKWLLMNKKATGYSSSCREFDRLGDIERRYRVRLGDRGTDKHGEYVEVIPLPPLPVEVG